MVTDNLSINSNDSTNLHNITEPIPCPAPQVVIRNEKGQFVPGVSGNPKGGPKKETNLLQMMRDKLEQPCDYCPDLTWAEAIVKRELEQGIADPVARKHLLDRLLGKAVESVKIGGDGTQVPISIVEVTLCKPSEPEQPTITEHNE